MPTGLEKRIVSQSRQAPRSAFDSVAVPERRRLFVDVSVLSVSDAGTGIQRVVRGISQNVGELAGEEWEVRFVSGERRRAYRQVAFGTSYNSDQTTMTARKGDVFLGLDYSLDAIPYQRRQLEEFRDAGGRLWFLVHDLLPLHRPEWFSTQTSLRYQKWLRTIASLADGFFCNSAQTETELREALSGRYGLNEGFRTSVLPMGADLIPSPLVRSDPQPSDDIPAQLEATPFILMVGTLEPRKGHDQVLSAFERLPPEENCALVFAGRPGWKVETLEQRLAEHPLQGRKLFWLRNASDQTLMELYRRCQGVIVAALAEGFGLPLVEALSYRRPVLARDLPVFRQHSAHGVRFFPRDATPEQLSNSIRAWLHEIRNGEVQVTWDDISWSATTKALLAALDPQ